MAKRKTTKGKQVAGTESAEDRSKIVKVRVSEDELKQLKVAAALSDTTTASYAREAALREAGRIFKEHGIKGV